MPKDTLTEEVKVRVPKRMRFGLEDIAAREGLDLSDIARRAFRDLLRVHAPEPPSLTTGQEYGGR